MTDDIASLVEEFEARRYSRRSCLVCDGPHLNAVNELLRRGGGAPLITELLLKHRGVHISQATIQRHRKLHFHVGPAEVA